MRWHPSDPRNCIGKTLQGPSVSDQFRSIFSRWLRLTSAVYIPASRPPEAAVSSYTVNEHHHKFGILFFFSAGRLMETGARHRPGASCPQGPAAFGCLETLRIINAILTARFAEWCIF